MENYSFEVPAESQPGIIDLFQTATPDQRNLMIMFFGDGGFLPLDIRERVQTFENACSIASIDPTFIDSLVLTGATEPESVIALIKLSIICTQLNELWTPNLSDVSQLKYFPTPDMQNGSLVYNATNYTTTSPLVPEFLLLKSPDLVRHLITYFKPTLDLYFLSSSYF